MLKLFLYKKTYCPIVVENNQSTVSQGESGGQLESTTNQLGSGAATQPQLVSFIHSPLTYSQSLPAYINSPLNYSNITAPTTRAFMQATPLLQPASLAHQQFSTPQPLIHAHHPHHPHHHQSVNSMPIHNAVPPAVAHFYTSTPQSIPPIHHQHPPLPPYYFVSHQPCTPLS